MSICLFIQKYMKKCGYKRNNLGNFQGKELGGWDMGWKTLFTIYPFVPFKFRAV